MPKAAPEWLPKHLAMKTRGVRAEVSAQKARRQQQNWSSGQSRQSARGGFSQAGFSQPGQPGLDVHAAAYGSQQEDAGVYGGGGVMDEPGEEHDEHQRAHEARMRRLEAEQARQVEENWESKVQAERQQREQQQREEEQYMAQGDAGVTGRLLGGSGVLHANTDGYRSFSGSNRRVLADAYRSLSSGEPRNVAFAAPPRRVKEVFTSERDLVLAFVQDREPDDPAPLTPAQLRKVGGGLVPNGSLPYAPNPQNLR
jgi:hypothetical protein